MRADRKGVRKFSVDSIRAHGSELHSIFLLKNQIWDEIVGFKFCRIIHVSCVNRDAVNC